MLGEVAHLYVGAHTSREHRKSEAKHLDGDVGSVESP